MLSHGNTKKTILSPICQKFELNNQKIAIFLCFCGISVIRRNVKIGLNQIKSVAEQFSNLSGNCLENGCFVGKWFDTG